MNMTKPMIAVHKQVKGKAFCTHDCCSEMKVVGGTRKAVQVSMQYTSGICAVTLQPHHALLEILRERRVHAKYALRADTEHLKRNSTRADSPVQVHGRGVPVPAASKATGLGAGCRAPAQSVRPGW